MKSVNEFTKTQPFFSKNVGELVDIARNLTADDLFDITFTHCWSIFVIVSLLKSLFKFKIGRAHV